MRNLFAILFLFITLTPCAATGIEILEGGEK